MQKIQKALFWTIVASESTHVFCCVLPTVVSVVSLLAGIGALSFLPGFMLDLHEKIHAYEIPTMIFSATMLAVGWALHFYSQRLDCATDSCCAHEPCAPKKSATFRVMVFATILFCVNIAIYFKFHYGHEHF